MPKSPTPQLDALIAQEPDFVDRIFDYLLAEFPQLSGPRLVDAKKAVRQQYGGREVYVRSAAAIEAAELAGQVLSLFNGRNATEVARRLGIGRATVYRLLKQSGTKKKSQASG